MSASRLFSTFVVILLAGLAAPLAAQNTPSVAIETNLGTITLELNADAAPKTVANFLQYVESGFYEGTVFHRVMDQFMIQGGGFDQTLNKKPTLSPVKNESKNGLSNTRGTIAMARTSDPHSATAQFYINHVDNLALDSTDFSDNDTGWGYAVFGKVTAGMEVVDKIATVQTRPQGRMANLPVDEIVIKKVTKISD